LSEQLYAIYRYQCKEESKGRLGMKILWQAIESFRSHVTTNNEKLNRSLTPPNGDEM